MPRAPHSGDWISLLALTVLWGSAFVLNEIALASLPPAVLVAGRILIAAAIIYGYLRLTGGSLPAPGRKWWPMFVLALFANVLPFHLIAWSQQHIDSSLAGVLMAVMPLFVLTLAHYFVPGARLTIYKTVGFVVGFGGVVVIIGPDFVRGVDGNLALWGAIAALGAALSYSISTIYTRRLGAGDPVRRSAGMLIAASLMSLPAAALDLPAVATPSLAAAAALAVLGLLTTGFATLLYFRLVQGPGPTFLSLVNYLVPAWAVIAGALFLDEALSPTVFIGLTLILFGIALSEIGPRLSRFVRATRARWLSPTLRTAAREDA
jgi:drug/metabolite transporter (DMT)-like permease